jgi:hypothetical protein
MLVIYIFQTIRTLTQVSVDDTPYLKTFKLHFNCHALTKLYRRIDMDRVSLSILNPYIKIDNLHKYKLTFDLISEVSIKIFLIFIHLGNWRLVVEI